MNPKTKLVTKEEAERNRKWLILDAKGKTLGRFASEIAKILRGKHKPDFTPHSDTGDGVIVINATEIEVTGNKEASKDYYYYTGFMSGLRQIPYRIMKEKKPEYIISHAVKGMLPKTKLSNAQMTRLRIFKGTEHNMQAQQPIQLDI